MDTLFFCLYIVNFTLLIVHEMESTYWEEWKLFSLPGGLSGFLLCHIPALVFLIAAVPQVAAQRPLGYAAGFSIAAAGIFAFSIHVVFRRSGKPGFTLPISFLILGLWLFTALALISVGLIILL